MGGSKDARMSLLTVEWRQATPEASAIVNRALSGVLDDLARPA
ncbi:MAG: hypothetical protein OXU86_02110 [Thaumarchaeota archaeon]|nr:hypothetical protein [Nitrososphaerota archaeon]MDD9814103.1 hypothetical protein [Nitrososphaerota archaeon]MDD9814106.1 hypothetical protein [Nitrososphaerota archaeon]MDD9825560.1 hypothetical protein [Nitrososphaerota archaeon]MDD9843648.1 hypothetical protein [Nitrososphaerota archaeon]